MPLPLYLTSVTDKLGWNIIGKHKGPQKDSMLGNVTDRTMGTFYNPCSVHFPHNAARYTSSAVYVSVLLRHICGYVCPQNPPPHYACANSGRPIAQDHQTGCQNLAHVRKNYMVAYLSKNNILYIHI